MAFSFEKLTGGGFAKRHVLAVTLIAFVLVWPATGQLLKPPPSSAPAPADAKPAPDPLGRSTPRGTISAFIRAVHRNDFVSAAWYMQLTPRQRPNVEDLAKDLRDLMDRYFSEPLAAISDSPTGALNDGLPLDRDRVGPLKMGNGETFDIELVRVNDPEAGPIWLISSDTLAKIPAQHKQIEKAWVLRVMPEVFTEYFFLGAPVAVWVGWALSLAIPLLVLWLISRVLGVAVQRIQGDAFRHRVLEAWFVNLRWPVILILTAIAHLMALPLLNLSLSFRFVYAKICMVLLVGLVAWLVRRIVLLSFERAQFIMQRRGQAGNASLLLLGQQVLNVIITLTALFVMLSVLGVDTKTALAGVGIGGVAVALGAQKSVENLLGGIFLLTDKALAIGDTCSISNRVGTIEDISLRSVRLRTVEQTLLSIPAGALSQSNIENLATRTKILVQSVLPLRYGTTAAQIETILEGIRKVLGANPKLEQASARVSLINFGARAIELELFAYVLTSDGNEFLRVREALFLQVAAVIEGSGSGFAEGNSVVYVQPGRDGASAVHGSSDEVLPEGAPDAKKNAAEAGRRVS